MKLHISTFYEKCQDLKFDLLYDTITEEQYKEDLKALKSKYDVCDDAVAAHPAQPAAKEQ